ncbi:MAG: zinc metallopeptidase [Planctomycetes bacterium]|nr:zinc metallopeptidase [Planctomycetota bacterium]
MYMPFDPIYFVFLAPALLLAMWAQFRVKSAYAVAQQIPASLSGAAAARLLLNHAGLNDISIEVTPGELSDHYDPGQKVLRLSPAVYHNQSIAAVGIAAHEAGHAMQDAESYALMMLRNAAVPLANFGGGISSLLLMVGLLARSHTMITIGIVAFSCVVFFQVVNLPVEFDASNRAKRHLVELGVIDRDGLEYVRGVLNAAAWTYVAGTLQSIMTLLYYVMRFSGGSRSDYDEG